MKRAPTLQGRKSHKSNGRAFQATQIERREEAERRAAVAALESTRRREVRQNQRASKLGRRRARALRKYGPRQTA